MVYKKYIKRGGKIYGPYKYHSRKINGRVITEYHGKYNEGKTSNKLIFLIIGLFVFCSLVIILNYSNPIKNITSSVVSEENKEESESGFAFIRFVIEIIKAEHLDLNRNFILDIYDEVKALDDVWSETISSGDYVRVTFEKNLTSENDITIYPRIISGKPKIEVYEADKTEIIAEFNNIISNEYNKVFLTNLSPRDDSGEPQRTQNVFDLLVLGGSLQFDYILDPATELFFEDCSSGASIADQWTVTGSGDSVWEYRGDGTCWSENANSEMFTTTSRDLTGYDYANLSFTWSCSGTEADDGIAVYVNSSSETGAGINVLPINFGAGGTETYNLSAEGLSMTTGVHIRVTIASDKNNEFCTIDGVNITGFTPDITDNDWPQFSNPQETPSDPPTYSSGASYEFNITITSTNGTAGLDFNDGNNTVTNLSDVFTVTINDLAVGNYTYYWWAYGNGTLNNYNTTIGLGYYSYNITKATGQVNLSLNGAEDNLTITYPQESNITASTPYGTVTIYRDGTVITGENGLNVTRGGGYYNITAISSGNQNYSSVSKTFWLNITRANNPVSLLLNGQPDNLSIVYPQQLNATASSDGGTVKIFREGEDVTDDNGLNVTLGVGYYTYFANATGNQNYSDNSTGVTFYANITQATSSINLTLNNTQGNITIYQGSTIDLNCSNITGDSGATLKLYKNGSLINQGISPLGNTTTFNVIQVENITCIYSESQNYTSTYETWWVNVTQAPDLINPNVTIISPLNQNYSIITILFNISAVDNIAISSCWYSLTSGTLNYSMTQSGDYWADTNSSMSQGSHTVNFYCNDTSDRINNTEQETFFVDTIPPYFTDSTPQDQTLTYRNALSYDINATDSGVGLDSFTVNDTRFKINISTGMLENNTVLGVNEYYLNITINDTLNNINSTVMLVNVTKATPTLTKYLNGVDNVTITYLQQLNASAYTTAGTVKIYRGGNDVTDDNGLNVTLGVGYYTYEFNVTGNQNYSDVSSVYLYANITQATSEVYTYLDNLRANKTITNNTAIWLNSTLQTGDSGATLKLYNNGVLINQGSSSLSNYTAFNGTGLYNITTIYVASQNYTTSYETWWVNVTALPLDIEYPIFSNYDETPANDTTYSQGTTYQFNVTVTKTNGTIWLRFDNTNYSATNLTADVYNVTITDLPAGTYYYNWSAYGNGTATNFNMSETRSYTVAKATPTLTKYLNGVNDNKTIQYPQQLNASAYTTAGTVKIYRDGSDVTSDNGLNVSLSAGYYEYEFNVTGNQNYSDISSVYLYANITQATGEINGTINGTQGNFTTINGTANQNIYINATNITGYGTGKIYVNGTQYNSGTLPLYNVTNLSIGFYNITFEYDGNQNYSSDIEVWWVNITIDNFPTINLVYPGNTTYNINISELNYTASDDYGLGKCWWSNNSGVWNSTPWTCGTNWTGLISIEGSNTWTVWANDSIGQESSDSVTFFKDTIYPAVIINSPLNQTYNTNSILFNITATDGGGISSCWYTINSGITNYTMTNVSSEYTDTNSSMSQDSHTVNFYCNDSFNNVNNSEQETFFIDSIYPLIDYESQTKPDNSIVSQDFIYVNVTWTESNFANITYRLYNSTNEVNTTTYTSAIYDINWTSLPNEVYTYNVTITDIVSNQNTTETRTITLDATYPQLSIAYPENTTYTVDVSKLNYTYTETNCDSVWWNNGTNNSTRQNCGTNWTSLTSIEGSNTWTVYINDTAGNENSTSVTFSKDTAYPALTIISPLNQTYNTSSILFNITATDGGGIGSCWYSLTAGTLNYSMTQSGAYWSDTNSSMSQSSHTVNFYCNDSSGNINNTEQESFFIDSIYPLIDYVQPTTDTGTYSQNFIQANITASDTGTGLDTIIIRLYNSTDLVQSNISSTSPLFINFTNLADGVYYLNATVNDTAGNTNNTETKTITLDNTYPQIYYNPNTDSSGFVNRDWIFINITASDLSKDSVRLEWEGANETFDNNPGGGDLYWENKTGLSQGSHSFYVWINDSSGNFNSTLTRTVIVDTINPSIALSSLTETPADPTNYSLGQTYEFNATISDANLDTVLIEFDGTNYTPSNLTADVYNFTITDLSAGTYNYRWYANDSINNINITGIQTYTINNATGNITLLINNSESDQTATYQTQTNASASTLYESVTLYRDGEDVTSENNDFVILSAGYYNYTAYSSGDQNHSSASITRFVNITRINSEVNLTLNNSQSNITINQGYTINLNCSTLTGDSGAYLVLYREGVLINNGTSSIGNTTTFSVVREENITCMYEETQNYTTISQTWFVNVTEAPDLTPPYFADNTPQDQNITYNAALGYDINATDVIEFDCFAVNDTRFKINCSGYLENNTVLGVGLYNLNITINDSVNNLNSTLMWVNVTPISSVVYTYLNHSRNNISIYTNTAIWLNSTLQTGDAGATLTLYNNGTQINSGTSPLANETTFTEAEIYNITTIYTASQNYTTSYETWWVNVTVEPDTTYPEFASFTEHPEEPITYLFNQVYEFNSTVTDTNRTVGLEFNNFNYSATNLTTNVYNVTIRGLSAGNYTYYWWAYGNGTEENYNTSGVYSYNISKAIPQGTLTNDTSLTRDFDETSTTISLSGNNDGDSDLTYIIYRDNIDVETSDSQAGAGTYNYILNTTGGLNWTANSSMDTATLTINQISPAINLTLNNSQGNVTIDQYSSIWLNGTLITGDSGATLRLYNDNSLINEGTTEVSNLTIFNAVGLFNITVFYLESQNYTSSYETWWVNVTQAPDLTNPSVTLLTETPADPTNYSLGQTYEFNATISDANLDTVLIEFDGTNYTATNLTADVYNFTVLNLAVGTYNYRWYANDTATPPNVNNTENGTYTIDQAIPLLNLTITPSIEEQYGTQTNATGSGCPAQLACKLYREGVEVINSEIVTLGVGIYNYTYNTTGNANYSATSVSDLLNITKATGNVSTYVNDTQGNITIDQYSSIWLNGTLEVGQAGENIKLYNNGTLINQGTTPPHLSNLTQFNITGLFNITTIYDGNENYTSAYETWFVNVTEKDITNPNINIVYPLNNTNTTNPNININYTVFDDKAIDSCWYSNDTFTLNRTLIDCVNITDVTWSEGKHNVTVWANDTSGNENSSSVVFFVDSIKPAIQFVIPTNLSGIITKENYIKINITASDSGTGLDTIVIRLYNSTHDEINSSNTTSSPNYVSFSGLSAGLYFYNATANDTLNNQNSTETRNITLTIPTLTIHKPKNETYLANTSLLLNYTASYEDYVWYNINGTNSTPINSLIYFNTSEGSHILYLYANNSIGTTTKNITFFVNLTKFQIYYDEFKGSNKGNSTNFNQHSFKKIQNLSGIVLENNASGKIEFNEIINLTADEDLSDNMINLSAHINISENRIEINSTALPNFNKSATLYLYNLDFSNPRILRDGSECLDICTKESYSGGTLKFNVTQFTVYEAEETPSVVTPSEEERVTGGGGGIIRECVNDTKCEGKDEVCWEHKCVKLFDIKIIDFESPIKLGEFFDFTYFVKGMADISGDVEIQFWIEKKGEIITSGSDIIYFGDFEEKTETTKIFLPSNVDSGIYDFFVQVSYGAYTAKSHRTIEIKVKEGFAEIISIETSEVKLYVISALVGLVVFILFFIFYLERKKIKAQFIQEKRWFKKYKVSVLTFVLFVVLGILAYYLNLFNLITNFVLNLWFYLHPYFYYILGTIFIFVVLTILINLSKKKKWVKRFKKWRIKRKRDKRLEVKYKTEVKKTKKELKKISKIHKRFSKKPRYYLIIKLWKSLKLLGKFISKKIILSVESIKKYKREKKKKREIALIKGVYKEKRENIFDKKRKEHILIKKQKEKKKTKKNILNIFNKLWIQVKKAGRLLIKIINIPKIYARKLINKFSRIKVPKTYAPKSLIEEEKILNKLKTLANRIIKYIKIKFKSAGLFLSKKDRLIAKEEKRLSKKAKKQIKQIYKEVFKQLRKTFGRKSQKKIIQEFEKQFIITRRLTRQHLKVLKNIVKAKTQFTKNRLKSDIKKNKLSFYNDLNKLKRNASIFISDLIKHSQDVDLISREKERKRIKKKTLLYSRALILIKKIVRPLKRKLKLLGLFISKEEKKILNEEKRLLKKISKQIKQIHKDVFKHLEKILGKKSQERIVREIEMSVLKKERFAQEHLRVLKDIIHVKTNFTKKRLKEEIRRDKSNLHNNFNKLKRNAQILVKDLSKYSKAYNKKQEKRIKDKTRLYNQEIKLTRKLLKKVLRFIQKFKRNTKKLFKKEKKELIQISKTKTKFDINQVKKKLTLQKPKKILIKIIKIPKIYTRKLINKFSKIKYYKRKFVGGKKKDYSLVKDFFDKKFERLGKLKKDTKPVSKPDIKEKSAEELINEEEEETENT